MPDIDEPTPEQMDLGTVLAALADRHRRRVIVALLAEPDGTERTCVSFDLPVSKATLTHHFRTLRTAGLIRQVNRGNSNMAQLRRAEVAARFPGLLELLQAEGERESHS
ncbi:ArsR/SmtB family transcription factor [Nocardia arthritidis]|nr:helix-turn-helix domain-containing protein [Nocardia arthritidis]